MEKMTDYELFSYGFKKQKDTWWGKKINVNAQEVRNGDYGQVVHEFEGSSGDCDGVKLPYFVLLNRSNNTAKVVRASESGVFNQYPSGGWGREKKINEK